MSGLSKICKRHGSIVTRNNDGDETIWVYDYAADKAVKKDEMPFGSARWKASEKARWAARTAKE